MSSEPDARSSGGFVDAIADAVAHVVAINEDDIAAATNVAHRLRTILGSSTAGAG